MKTNKFKPGFLIGITALAIVLLVQTTVLPIINKTYTENDFKLSLSGALLLSVILHWKNYFKK